MPAELHATVVVRLRAVGQRYTTQRRALVDLLAGAPHPLSIPDVLTLEPGLAQSSVYRNLAVLEQAGVVRRVVATDFARYELTEDLTEHHHHLICSECGSVEDFTASSQVETSVARAISDIADRTGFTPEHHRLDLIGVCASCG